MKFISAIIIFFVTLASVSAQNIKIKGNQGGLFSLGVRSSTSVFSHGKFNYEGIGSGGQFRLQLANRINTEWFLDYMRSNVEGLVSRTDYHIGWSVMYYFTDSLAPHFKPYIVAGHCFDQTVLVDNSNPDNKISRKSSAIQAGAGLSFNLSKRMDLTLLTQYMFHLGKDVHADIENDDKVVFEKHKGTMLEGHLLIDLSINYKIADLWTGKKHK